MANYVSTHTGEQIDEAVDKVLAITSTAEQIDDTVNRTATYANRNIVDNPFFTVRQRSVVDENGYFFDRWKRQQSVITMSDNGDGITLTTTATGSSVVSQFLENNIPQGTTVTLSVEFSQTAGSANGAVRLASNRSGTVISGSSISLGTGVATHKFLSLTIALPTDCVAVDIRVPQGGTLTVHAIKLEYGSVSTLANESAPNYADELLKCQRYYWKAPYNLYATGFVSSSAKSYLFNVVAPAVFRASPTLSNFNVVCRGVNGYTSLTPSSTAVAVPFSARPVCGNNLIISYTADTAEQLAPNNSVVIIDIKAGAEFSADL